MIGNDLKIDSMRVDILERAKEYAPLEEEELEGFSNEQICKITRWIDNAYIQGATEQLFLDNARLTVLDADGNPVTAETLKNACEIVRTTTKRKIIDKACENFNNFMNIRIGSECETSKEMFIREREYWLKDFRYVMEEA